MASKPKKELNVDFIQSRSLTEHEAKELSAFIKMLKQKGKKKKATE